MYNQEAIVNRRKHKIALLTDSIADLPQEYIDEHQIQVVHYFDKLTIQPTRLLELVSSEMQLPKS